MSWSNAADLTIRNRHRTLFREILLKDKLFKNKIAEDLEAIVEAIEKSCHNEAIRNARDKHVSPINWSNSEFCDIYSSIIYKIAQNLDAKVVGSRYLLKKIADEEIDLKVIATMTSHELCPEKSNAIMEEKNKRINEKVELKSSDRYKCPNCSKHNATYQYVQLRSFDEGYNLSLTCIDCGHRWIK
jgi:DNA-directed RNA polymerase subunit M/transcription elongation factor TFIIS